MANDNTAFPPPPAPPRRTAAWLLVVAGAAAVLGVGAIGMAVGWIDIGADDAAADPTTVPTTQRATDTTRSTASTSTAPTAAPSSSSSPTSTTPPTTTKTTKPVDFDHEARLVLGGIAGGDAGEVVGALLEMIEPYPLDRVDVVTASVNPPRLIIDARSGYSTEEYQLEATVEALALLAEMWGIEPFDQVDTVAVDLDLTVDDRRWIVPHDSMVAVLSRRLTPVDALLEAQRGTQPLSAAPDSGGYDVVVTEITTLPPPPPVQCAPGETEVQSDGRTIGCAPRHLDRDGDGIGCE